MSDTIFDRFNFRYKLFIKGLKDVKRGSPVNVSTFTGSIFDRMNGLDSLMKSCQKKTILDLGSCDGLVDYEFSKYGPDLIHGFDYNLSDVLFSMRLFRNVPVENKFTLADLSKGAGHFKTIGKNFLRPDYDIVLFLGVYHHLKGQMTEKALSDLLDCFLDLSRDYFVIRTNMLDQCHEQILAKGFKVESEDNSNSLVGRIAIYRKDMTR